ncbi:bifunctional methylenetetrahydrofolate dehydrogenase/methenyltetrahydrofolate cyclohydrolase FolD [Dasania marina]|uniref:bifunctional methylenetetrahydrofolate dehydrogenase/methenyltetrahydrofolate cyclohydrolase FolD n=1 Tax=Dasania marina TaxID=471499 RepID=UPI00036C6086|nr:bifunctional methylenetetrahydrofolate dehydrogenase/methenyltetrahydrofolate cyclohydrolase FolD [Dasania marina]
MNIDGKQVAADLRLVLAQEVAELKKQTGITPGLTVVLVGEDPASQVYVRNKVKQTQEVGMISNEFRLAADTSQDVLLAKLDELNNDPTVHGILVQLPLPKHIDESLIIESIVPEKDVDGFHAMNSGRLMNGDAGALVPCTPQGCVILAKKHLGDDLSGKHAVIIGRSNIVGKPVAMLLLQESCTVTIAHSRTKDLPALCRQADILVAAVGRPEMVKGDWIKPGATVIDVGINRIETEDGKTRLVGDVDFAEAEKVAGAITPVPGGVGPMTIACLLKNTIEAARRFGVRAQ